MDLVSFPFLGLVGVGVVAGALSGLLGVGGATVSTPGVRLFGATPIQAVGSTIPPVLPSAIIGAWRYAKAGMVDWPVALLCGGFGSVAAVGGALLSNVIDPRLLMVMTAAVLLWSGITVLRSRSSGVGPDVVVAGMDDGDGIAVRGTDLEAIGGIDEIEAWLRSSVVAPTSLPLEVVPTAGPSGASVALGRGAVDQAPAPSVTGLDHFGGARQAALIMGMGVAAGLVAGLLGIGGGVVMMPLFTGILAMPVKRAVPTSLVAVALFSIPALITHTLLGHVDWTIALALIIGQSPGARLGSRWSINASDETLRKLFGLFLVLLAVVFGLTQLHTILH